MDHTDSAPPSTQYNPNSRLIRNSKWSRCSELISSLLPPSSNININMTHDSKTSSPVGLFGQHQVFGFALDRVFKEPRSNSVSSFFSSSLKPRLSNSFSTQLDPPSNHITHQCLLSTRTLRSLNHHHPHRHSTGVTFSCLILLPSLVVLLFLLVDGRSPSPAYIEV
jgi:hypothetical protein